jgi:adenylate cyclase
MVLHVLGTRLVHELYGTVDNYVFVALALWVADPAVGIRQSLGLIVAWAHGCLGLHFWLRLRPWYPAAAPYLFAAVLLLPVLALLGFVRIGQELDRLMATPGWIDSVAPALNLPTLEQVAGLYRLERQVLIGFGALLALTLAARYARAWFSRHMSITIGYPDGHKAVVQRGATILDASRAAGIPHASVCGGRGRCSTCRVRVLQGAEHLPPPSEEERRVLERVKAGPGVRLACQTRPRGDVDIVPLLPPAASPRVAYATTADVTQGHEEEIAILFADLRAFTALSSRKLPFDVVFLLNRYFRAMGTAVEESGGRVDKFIGDGVMALFGIGRGAEEGCRQALAAARRMAENLDQVNTILSHDLETPLRLGVGIHVGPAIVGEMGYGHAVSVTAIGDAVNTASRLEALTKDYACQLVVSETVAARAGVDLSAFPRHEIKVRGRDEAMHIRVIVHARDLPPPPSPDPRRSRRRTAEAEPAPAAPES